MSTTMPFGKHKGKRLCDVPTDYLKWCLDNCDRMTPSLRNAIKHQLAKAEKPANVPSVNVCHQWYRTLSREFHPDLGGSHEAMKAINRGRDVLLQLVEASS